MSSPDNPGYPEFEWAVRAPDGRLFRRTNQADAELYLPAGYEVVRRAAETGWEPTND